MRIRVNTSSPYDVAVERGILKKCGEYIAEVTQSRHAAIITDDIVDGIYAETVEKSLAENGFKSCKFVFKNGEASKNLGTLGEIFEFLSGHSITRRDIIVALGGGVTGDMAGFAAASYLRGIDFVQIPTTLLAQIDSSVGGKTGVDIPSGKNLIGAFKQPALVICDSDTLKTLSPEIMADGMAEAIKYGMIRDRELFDKISARTLETVDEIIDEVVETCINIKRTVVENDELETGERMILNFGHTIGHAVEGYYNYETYTHGSAVAIGMCHMCRKTSGEETVRRLVECVKSYGLPTELPVHVCELLPFCGKDKKREGGSINYIVCETVGAAAVRKASVAKFAEIMGENDEN